MTMEPVLHGFGYGLDYLRDQVADVGAADMVAQPPGVVNHPAWVIGHLTFTGQALGEAIGLSAWLPADHAARHGPGSLPIPDPDGYEEKETALARLDDARSRLTRAVEGLDDRRLDEPFPDPAYRAVFPSLRHALTQVLVGHTAFHVGQVSVWRRAMGLPGIGRSFE